EIDFGALTNELLMNGGLDPFTIIHALNNNTLALVSIVHELRGDCAALVQGESAAVTALQRATFSLRNGHCDIALVVGAGSYNEPLTLAGHYRLGHLSKDAGGDGQLRSFDSAQDGTV
ncbi:beta-ketoacyl synthase N-terminal-like domain-containing protein, partial [Mycobacteroides abscessus subsp. massiliense]